MRDALVAVDASHAVLGQRLMRAGRFRWLLRERHGGRRMTAAALGRIVRLELSPDFLSELRAMRLIFRRRIELAPDVAPHLGVRLDVAPQAGEEFRRHVAVAAACLDAEGIGIVHAPRELLVWGAHLVTRGAKLVGLCKFEAAQKTAREHDARDERDQPSGRYAEQEPTLRATPQPGPNPATRRLWRIHVELSDVVMITSQLADTIKPPRLTRDRQKMLLAFQIVALYVGVQTTRVSRVNFQAALTGRILA